MRTSARAGLAIAVLLAISAAAIVAARFARTPAPRERVAEEPPALWPDLRAADVVSFAIATPGGRCLVELGSDDVWRVVEPVPDLADRRRVLALIEAFASLRESARRQAGDIEGGPRALGLHEGGRTIVLARDRLGSTHRLAYGTEKVAGGYRAAQIDGTSELAFFDEAELEAFVCQPDSLRQRRLLDAELESTTALRVGGEKERPEVMVVRESNSASWRVVVPLEDVADAARVADLVDAVTSLRAERFLERDIDPGEELAWIATWNGTDGRSGTIEIFAEIPASGGLRSARVSGRPGSFAVRTNALERELAQPALSWRSPVAAAIPSFSVTAVRVERGGRSLEIVPSLASQGSQRSWSALEPAGKRVADERVLELLSLLGRLDIRDFGETVDPAAWRGGSRSLLRVTVSGQPPRSFEFVLGEPAPPDGVWIATEGRPLWMAVDGDLERLATPESLTVSNQAR